MFGIQSCRQVGLPSDISGLWYSCNENGVYSELLADHSYFLSFDEKGPEGQIWKYKIKNDTLYFELPEIEGVMTQWAAIDKFEKDHLILHTVNQFDKEFKMHEFFRLKEKFDLVIDPKKLIEKSEDLQLLRSHYEERQKKNKCKMVE